jgi:PAS domain S-box-containing protein
LQQQRDWFDVTLSSIGDAVIATDTNGMVTFINPMAEKLTGWAAAEAIGTPVQDVLRLIHEQSREPMETPVPVVLQEQAAIALSNHTVLIARHGGEIAIADSAAPILDRHGVPHGVVLTFRDVTENQRLETELR